MSLESVAARNERLRAEGKLPGAKGTGTRVEVRTKSQPARVSLAMCAHLGDRVSGACGALARRCNLHGTTTSAYTKCDHAERHCPACPDFAQVEPPAGVAQ